MADPVRLMSSLAVELAFKRDILPRWRAAGRGAEVDWAPTSVLARAIDGGARADVVVMIDAEMARLAAQGVVDPASVTALARAHFGVAARAGAEAPDISTPEAFFAAMERAPRVAYSLSGASGLHFMGLMRARGLEAVLERGVAILRGFTAEKLVSGEADLAVQQVSELMAVEGVAVLGPFPGETQRPTDFSAAIFAEARDPAAARAFLAHLSGGEAEAAYRAGGLVPRRAA